MIDDEKHFLHDISSPLTSLQLNLESIAGMLEENNLEVLPDCLMLLGTCQKQTKKLTDMLRARRDLVTASTKSE